MQAFDIGTNLLEDFQNLGFLKRRTVEDFKPIYDDIEAYASETEYENDKNYKEKIEWI